MSKVEFDEKKRPKPKVRSSERKNCIYNRHIECTDCQCCERYEK